MNDSVRTPEDSSLPRRTPGAPPAASRRALLIAMPTIVSLHPGLAAAHARSSSQLVLTDIESKQDTVYCAEKPWGAKETGKGWDIGDQGWFKVTELSPNNRYYRLVGYDKKKQPKDQEVSRQTMCREGGEYYYEPKQEKYGYTSFDEGLETFGADDTLDSLDTDDNGLLAQGDDWLETTGFGGGGKDGGKDGDGKDGGKHLPKVKVPRGGMVSATALASFAGRYKITASV